MARKKQTIKGEDLYRFELINDMQISPDGKQVLYAQQRVDRKTEKKYTNLWIVPTGAGAARQFTYGNQSDGHPRWSPDGKQIAFISNRTTETQAQIYVIAVGGGEARKVTDLKGRIFGFRWSPDGKDLLLSLMKKDKEAIEREKDENKKKLGIVARHYTRPFYKMDGMGFLGKERVHIWVVNVKTGSSKQLTDHKIQDQMDPQWTPDGKHILYMSNKTDEPDINIHDDKMYVMPVKGGKAREIRTPKGEFGMPSISPDGKWIAFVGTEGEGDWWKNTRLWIARFDGKKKAECLTPSQDWDIGNKNINDVVGAHKFERPQWSPDGTHIYFQVSRHGDTVVKRIEVESGEVDDEINRTGAVGSFMFDKTHDKLCYYFGDVESPGQIYVRDMSTGREKQLTKVNETMLGRIDLGELEEVWFKGSDGNYLQGWILKPPGFNPKKKYPSILEIHGGPLMMYGNMFMHEFYYLAAQGYVVYFCNPRGGQGYGEKHAKAIHNGWGTKDYEDLMKFANMVARKPYIDKDRRGVTGGSYGGYMTNWIIGQTDRFKAAVTQRSVSNLISMWGSSDFNWVFQLEFGEKPPWENMNNFWKQSPMKHIGNAKTPTMVIHSESDHRCQIEQGEQVFVALKLLGVDTEFVRFPDEPHGLSRGGRTDRRIERLKSMLRWFDKYLKK